MVFAAHRERLRALYVSLRTRSRVLWRRYRALPRYQQALILGAVIALLLGLIIFARNGDADQAASSDPTVTLATVGELSGTGGTVDFIGTVRSISEADILAQNGGTVQRVHARLSARVPAGYVIAELDNASERATVLQAEGSYDAAVAARDAQSLPDVEKTARDTYRSTFTTLDTALENQIDASLFGAPTAVGPDLLVNSDYDTGARISRERTRIAGLMNEYEGALRSADGKSPATLLDEAEAVARQIQVFLNELADVVNARDSDATASQLTALGTARASVDDTLSDIASARTNLRSGSVSANAGASASVKQALGVLRGAQALLEKTIIRAPIAGQVNFLPIRVGDYVTPLQHVATVAQNGALEIVVYVSENNRDLLVAGGSATVDGNAGVITSIAPALDPTNKQIEVHVGVAGATGLVNGQSVHVQLPDLAPKEPTNAEAGPILLPLASVKLRAGDRIVFSVGEDSRLVAHQVEVGEVRGDRIEILTPLPSDLRIVADARGLAEGERVAVASP